MLMLLEPPTKLHARGNNPQESEIDTMIMIRVQILLIQDVQEDPLRYVMSSINCFGTEIHRDVPKNHELSHRCTYKAGRS